MWKNWNPSTLHIPPLRGQIPADHRLADPVEDVRVQVQQSDQKNTRGGRGSAASNSSNREFVKAALWRPPDPEKLGATGQTHSEKEVNRSEENRFSV